MQRNGRQYFDVKVPVDAANEIDFDLILLAIHMPVTGGLSAAKKPAMPALTTGGPNPSPENYCKRCSKKPARS
jgi:hypothetical protein